MDTKYLSKQHQTWILRVKVPSGLRKQEGQARITVSLQTSDLREARTRRDIELGRLRERWTKMRESDNASPSTLKWLLDRLTHVREENFDNETAYVHASELLDVFLREQREDVPEESAEAIEAAMASISDPTFSSGRLTDHHTQPRGRPVVLLRMGRAARPHPEQPLPRTVRHRPQSAAP